MDKNKAKDIANDMAAALKAVADKHGMTVSVQGGTFDTTGVFKPRVEFRAADADRQEFVRYAVLVGVKPELFGKRFTVGGSTYVITGLKPAASRRPVMATRTDGMKFVFPVEMINAVADLREAK